MNNGALALASMNGHLDVVKFLVDVVHMAVNDKHQVEKLRCAVVLISFSLIISILG